MSLRTLRTLSWSENQVQYLFFTTAGAITLALMAQVKIPLPGTPVPFTLQVLAVILFGMLLGPRLAVAAVAEYLLLGVCGLPVFAGWTTGHATLTGMTGGYLFGFLLAALLCGPIYWRVAAESTSRRLAGAMLAGMIGIVAIYLPGWLWFAVYSHMGLANAFTLAVIPFIIPDILKVSAVATSLALWRKGAA